MTKAQKATLAVLVERGGWIRGGRQGSASTPVPRVNTTAAFSLCDLGFAEMQLYRYATTFSSAYEFQATAAGKAALG